MRPSLQDCTELMQTNKQPSRQSDVLPCVNVGYHCGPPSLSPQRTFAGPDKLDLAAPKGPVRKDSVDVGYSRTDRKPTACVMSLNTSHIQIKVTQPGLYEAQANIRERERGAAEIRGLCQTRFMLCCLTS